MKQRDINDYQNYKAVDFALDSSFKEWVNNPDADSFWIKWCANHPEKQEEVHLARLTISTLNFDQEHISDSELDAQWRNLQEEEKQYSSRKNKPGFGIYFQIAAILILTISLVVSITNFNSFFHSETSENWVRKETLSGEKMTVSLPDGSIAKLNAETSLEYSRDFNGNIREVSLQGEAFFEVKHHSDKPFIVKTGELSAVVLGTSFNINSYEESSQVQVAIEEGSVKVVNHKNTGIDNSLFLKPGELLTINRQDYSNRVTPFNGEDILGWREGIFNLNKVSFPDAIQRIERWYGVEFIIDEKFTLDSEWRFHGKFKNKSLNYILSVMSYPDLFAYKIKDNKVIIYSNNENRKKEKYEE